MGWSSTWTAIGFTFGSNVGPFSAEPRWPDVPMPWQRQVNHARWPATPAVLSVFREILAISAFLWQLVAQHRSLARMTVR
jgi:hypothetical protein